MAAGSSSSDSISLASSEFNDKFVKEVLPDAKVNIVCSPVSVHLALAMLHAGARGETAKELAKVICLTSDMGAALNGIIHFIRKFTRVKLNIANKMFVQRGFITKPLFAAALAANYCAATENVNFRDEATVDIINNWVARETKDKITKIVSPGDFDNSTCLVLVNAVYFNGPWMQPFDQNETGLEFFFTDDMQMVLMPFMKKTDLIGYAQLDYLDAQIIEISFVSPLFSFVVVKPNQWQGLYDLEQKLACMQISQLLQYTHRQRMEISIPKFKLETTLNLKSHMFGLEQIFTQNADLSGIVSVGPELNLQPVRVSGVIQKVVIEVNEYGTETAAATALSASKGDSLHTGAEELKVKCNHPLVFFIVYRRKLALFSGRLARPAPCL